MNHGHPAPVCDYEDSDYRTRFWEGQQRAYEDRVERVALQRLLPASGDTLIDIGAGFGRLAGEYRGYRRVVLFDYSSSLLREAQQHLGQDPRYIYVAGNWYQMPFVDGLFQVMTQIRTIHHAADVPALFEELQRIARPGGTYVLEYANKRNLKALLRYAARRQEWSPFDPEPVEFVELNFDFHPSWIKQRLLAAGFTPGRALTVSHFRLGLLKRLAPTGLLVTLDSLLQWTGDWIKLSPSVFLRSTHAPKGPVAGPGPFFACPRCKTPLFDIAAHPVTSDTAHTCPGCGSRWQVAGGIYDFKEPV